MSARSLELLAAAAAAAARADDCSWPVLPGLLP